MKFEIVNVTPNMAAEMLGKNEGNRKLREPRAAYLARAILEDKWILTHQPIAIGRAGRLLDGQHRLRAICLANKAAKLVIATGVPDEAYAVMDAGLPRSMAERVKADPKRVTICNQIFRILAGNALPHEYEIQLMLDIMREPLDKYMAVSRTTKSPIDRAPFAVAIVMRIVVALIAGNNDEIARIQWIIESLRKKNTVGLPPIAAVLYRQALEPNVIVGVSREADQFCRAWNAFDPEKQSMNRIQINDHSADIREARGVFRTYSQGVFE